MARSSRLEKSDRSVCYGKAIGKISPLLVLGMLTANLYCCESLLAGSCAGLCACCRIREM
jgi:hypothetical protein